MNRFNSRATRRSFIVSSSRFLLAVPAMLAVKPALANKASKSDFAYQEKPKDGKTCATCTAFVAPGQCRLLEGEVKPEGWCVAYSPK